MSEHRVITTGLQFPEGPIALPDGSVLLVEIKRGTLTRVAADGKQTIEQLLKSKGVTVNGYVLYVVGEGIERKSSDFAAEVMATAGAGR